MTDCDAPSSNGRRVKKIRCDGGAGAAAGAIAATIVCPLDVIKTRLQVLVKEKGSKIRRPKGAIFRPAAVAAFLSISSEGINNRNRILLNKAQKVWEENLSVGLSYEEDEGLRNKAIAQWDFKKSLEVSYDGDEGEVISKIAEMEENDEACYRAMLEEGQ